MDPIGPTTRLMGCPALWSRKTWQVTGSGWRVGSPALAGSPAPAAFGPTGRGDVDFFRDRPNVWTAAVSGGSPQGPGSRAVGIAQGGGDGAGGVVAGLLAEPDGSFMRVDGSDLDGYFSGLEPYRGRMRSIRRRG